MKTKHCRILAIAVFAASLQGCWPSDEGAAPIVDHRAPHDTESSDMPFDCLASQAGEESEVQWDVAVTLAAISEAVYGDEPTVKAELKNLGATFVTPIFDTTNECVIASDDKSVVLAFRGTEDLADVLTDIKILASRRTDERQHAGFYGGVDDIYAKLLVELERTGTCDKQLWVTGHSLGGALAAVFAHRAASTDNIRARGVMTFGQPLVFGSTSAQAVLDKFNFDYVRFVNSWDPITRCLPNYRHAGSRVHLTRSGYSYRKPMISLKSTGNDDTSGLMFIEDDEELVPMTEEEFKTFEQKWNQMTSDSPPSLGSTEGAPIAGSSNIPFFRRHQMDTYSSYNENAKSVKFLRYPMRDNCTMHAMFSFGRV